MRGFQKLYTYNVYIYYIYNIHNVYSTNPAVILFYRKIKTALEINTLSVDIKEQEMKKAQNLNLKVCD